MCNYNLGYFIQCDFFSGVKQNINKRSKRQIMVETEVDWSFCSSYVDYDRVGIGWFQRWQVEL